MERISSVRTTFAHIADEESTDVIAFGNNCLGYNANQEVVPVEQRLQIVRAIKIVLQFQLQNTDVKLMEVYCVMLDLNFSAEIYICKN